jgi:hypothetical protein
VDEIVFPEDFYDLGNHFAEDLYDWGRRVVPLSKLYPGICITTEEKHGKPQSG